MNLLGMLTASAPVKIVLATVVYLLYAALLGLGLMPAFYLAAWAFQELVAEALFSGAFPAGHMVLTHRSHLILKLETLKPLLFLSFGGGAHFMSNNN